MALSPVVCGGGDETFSHTRSDAAARSSVPLDGDRSGEELVKGFRVVPVVVLVARFDDVSRRVAFAVVVMLSKNRSLYKAPKTFNRVGVNQPLCVGYCMVNGEVRNPLSHAVVAREFVRNQYAVILIYELPQERFERLAIDFIARLGYNLPPLANAPMTGCFLAPRPRLGGS